MSEVLTMVRLGVRCFIVNHLRLKDSALGSNHTVRNMITIIRFIVKDIAQSAGYSRRKVNSCLNRSTMPNLKLTLKMGKSFVPKVTRGFLVNERQYFKIVSRNEN